jgi:hypothetical protein
VIPCLYQRSTAFPNDGATAKTTAVDAGAKQALAFDEVSDAMRDAVSRLECSFEGFA